MQDETRQQGDTGTAKPLITHIAEGTVGGLARQLDLVAGHIPARGFRLQFVVSCERDPGFARDIEEFRSMGHRVDVVPMVREPSPFVDWRTYLAVRAALADAGPDLVHTHCSKAGILGRRAAHRLGIPSAHTPHVYSFEWAGSKLKRQLYRRIERWAAAWCNKVILLSQVQLDGAVAAGIGPREQFTVIPNGVSTKDYRPATSAERKAARKMFDIADTDTVVGVAARLEPQKGMGHFLRAARLAHNVRPETIFLIAGDGSLADECRRRVGELGLEGVVRFTGDVHHILGFYHAIDCFALASLWEGLPYVVLEAMSCAIPLVSTRSFGCDSLIDDGRNGILVKIGDEQSMAEAVCHLLDDREFAAKLGQAGRASVSNRFTVDQWADSLASCYHDILDPAGR